MDAILRRLGRTSALVVALMTPAAVNAQQPESHTVRTGDTLWDLAQQYLGDPFLWPEIYRLNTQVVEDPHWIYPGEILLLRASADVTAVPTTDTPIPAAGDVVAAGDGAQPADSAAPAEAPVAEAPMEPVDMGAADPGAAEDGPDDVDMTPLFGRGTRGTNEPSLERLQAAAYRAVRPSEFYSSGFLTENEKLPFGRLIGPAQPPQIASIGVRATVHLYGQITVMPPADAKYQVGDSLLLVTVTRRIGDHGEVVVPTGLARVTDVSRPENLAEIIAEYGAIRARQMVLPAERFRDPGSVRPVPISDGVEGVVIDSRDRQELKGPQDILFLDKGRKDGVSLGDLFEVRREAERRPDGSMSAPEVMGVMQVVHVREHSATARLVRVVAPNILPGAKVKQVAKLPS